jgi:alpha-beta hydrolase superfamily lysophospholipase
VSAMSHDGVIAPPVPTLAYGREDAGMLARPDGERVAWRKLQGHGPTVVWLNGYRSDMMGTKAQAVAEWAAGQGRSLVRFDYMGHGASTGDFAKGTIGRWLQDALVVIDWLTRGPLVLVGSSMGGWLACLAALARPERMAGLVLIAPAADFTDKLIEPALSPEAAAAIKEAGVWMRPSPYGPAGDPITRTLLQDGRRWSILPGPVPIQAPVRVLHGGDDDAVPWTHGLKLVQAIESRDVVFTFIRDGDHRLSRPQDMARLIAAIEELL